MPAAASGTRPGLNRTCSCDAGTGDFGCQRDVPLLQNDGVTSAQVAPGEWSYFQIEVSKQASSFTHTPGLIPPLRAALADDDVGRGAA